MAVAEWRLVVDQCPSAVLVGDPDGLVAFANKAAARALGRDDLVGRPVRELLDDLGRLAPGQSGLPVGEGMRVWYPGSADLADAVRDLQFSAELSDGLAGTLNLRRTLARIVDLAVPALGDWAGVTRREAEMLRQISRSAEGATDDRTVHVGRMPDDQRRIFEGLMAEPGFAIDGASPDRLRLLGAPDALVERWSASDGGEPWLVTTVLRAHGRVVGLLAIAGAGVPDRAAVDSLARRAAVAVAAAEVYEERSTLAATLRRALLPQPLPVIEGICIGASYRPALEATEIGGDFYEVRSETGGWSTTIGDVCGKGVEAAVLTGQVRQSLRTVSLVTDDPVRRLELLNSTMLSSDGTSFVTLIHAVMRADHGAVQVQLAAGGHPAPLLRRSDGSVLAIDAPGPIVGMLADVRFQPASFAIGPGETLLCYTDGVVDAKGPSGLFGDERVGRLLADSSGLTAQALCERILQDALEHLDGRPHDDMALLAVQVDTA